MKETELMKYDWVMFDDESYEPYEVKRVYLQVDHFNCGNVYGKNESGYGTYIAFCEEECQYASRRYGKVIPIPLTEEILKANADGGSCSFDEFRSLYHLKNNGYHREISISFDKTWHVPFVEITGMGHATIKINMQYVHELQHALRLCGLNDLADNFKVIA